MTDKIKRIIPIGINPNLEKLLIVVSFVVSVCRSLFFFIVYSGEYSSLFVVNNGQKILSGTKMMSYFNTITPGCFDGFIISIFIFLSLIFIHYGYHYKDSKSIYTMKRLPQRNELHIRCLALPLSCIAVYTVTSLLLLFIFYKYYMIMTPPECLYPEDQWKMFWINLIYGGDAL